MNPYIRNDAADADIDFARLVRALHAARYRIGAIVLATALVTYAAVSMMAPKYRSEAKILIESQESVFTGKERGLEADRALLDQQGIISQVQLLESSDLARTIIKRFNLLTVDEFNPTGRALLSDFLAAIGMSEDASSLEDVLNRFFDRLEVYQVERSRVIVVRFWSEDPELAARIANGIVDEYFSRQSEAKRVSNNSTISLLAPEIERLEGEARDAQRRVAEFRAGADLFMGTDNQTLGQQQLGELNSQLSAARAAKSEAEAKASLILELLRSGSALETAGDVLSSQLIQRLRERQVTMNARIAELSTTLLPNHPQIKAMRSQLADLDRQITIEARKIVRGYESEARLAEARMQSLMDNLNELKAQTARANQQEVQLSELERDAAIKASRLETLMGQYREVETRRSARDLPVDARRISAAAPANKPFAPRKMAITAGVTLAMLLLCLGYVVMREFISGNVFAENRRGRPVPHLPLEADLEPVWSVSWTVSDDEELFADGEGADNVTRIDDETRRRTAAGIGGALAHLVRPLDEGYDWLDREELVCTMVAARAEPSVAVETGLDLARRTSDDDRSCILIVLEGTVEAIDSDAAEPGIDGFTELLAGTASFAEVIHQDRASRAHIIPAGREAVDMEAIDIEQFGFLVGALSQTYDRVVVASGALGADLATIDLLRQADSVILSVVPGPDDAWGLAAFETLTSHGFDKVFVAADRDASARSAA